jgi:FAD-dependent urate hydroxylase
MPQRETERSTTVPVALICGGGVAGLSTALHLKRVGFRVRLFEKDDALRTAGVGLNVWPNGVRVIAGLSLGAEYFAEASVMNQWLAIDSSGEVTSDVDLSGWGRRYGAPLTGARRRELNALLACGLSDEEVQLGWEACSYDQDDDTVTVHFANGEAATGDLLVGADGIGSNIRNRMLGRAPEFTDEGLVRWRGVFRCADAGVATDVQADVLGENGHFGWIPIGDGLAYWYGSVSRLSGFDDVCAVYRSWSRTSIPKIIDSSLPSTVVGRSITHYKQHLESWVDDRVVLIGDAAHPMYPGMAQGANQALEDAEALTRNIDQSASLAIGLGRFERERMPIANKMVDYSRLSFEFSRARQDYSSTGENLQIKRYLEFEPGKR